MRLSDWLNLCAFILSIMGIGLFSKTLANDEIIHDCPESPFLCGQKIKLLEASPHDFTLVKGISLKTAREIFKFIKEHPEAKLEDLDNVRGIGPKSISKLALFFN